MSNAMTHSIDSAATCTLRFHDVSHTLARKVAQALGRDAGTCLDDGTFEWHHDASDPDFATSSLDVAVKTSRELHKILAATADESYEDLVISIEGEPFGGHASAWLGGHHGYSHHAGISFRPGQKPAEKLDRALFAVEDAVHALRNAIAEQRATEGGAT